MHGWVQLKLQSILKFSLQGPQFLCSSKNIMNNFETWLVGAQNIIHKYAQKNQQPPPQIVLRGRLVLALHKERKYTFNELTASVTPYNSCLKGF